MSKLRVAVGVVSIAAVATFGVAACGGKKSVGGSGGGEINVTMTSFPDYVDPSCPTPWRGGRCCGTPTPRC